VTLFDQEIFSGNCNKNLVKKIFDQIKIETIFFFFKTLSSLCGGFAFWVLRFEFWVL